MDSRGGCYDSEFATNDIMDATWRVCEKTGIAEFRIEDTNGSTVGSPE
jgi:hypothetical protein